MADVRQTSLQRPTTPLQRNHSSNAPYLSPPQFPMQIQTTGSRPLSNLGPLSPVNQNGSFAFDRVIKRGRINRRVKKKGAFKASWKPAYLVLRPNLLSVYKDEDETELSASITLSDVTTVAPVKKSRHDHVFGVFSPSKNHHFAGLTAVETAEWLVVIRMEARTEDLQDLQPPKTNFAQAESAGYESTDISVDDEADAPASPEAVQWSVRGSKIRSTTQSRGETPKLSTLTPYSANDQFTTSQSDVSDAFTPSALGPKSFLSSSVPAQPSILSPIPDNAPINPQSRKDQLPSSIPDTFGPAFSQPTGVKNISQPSDPLRVIRQGHLRLSKTTSGVRQWKTVWVVLRAPSLNIYKSNSETSPILVVPMYGIIEAAEIDRKRKQNCFQVICEDKIYRLQADNEDDLENWLGAFKSVLVKQEVQRSSRHTSMSLGQGVSLPQTLPTISQNLAMPPPLPPPGRVVQVPNRDGERVVTPGAANGQMGQLASGMQGLGIKGDGEPVQEVAAKRVPSTSTSVHAAVTSLSS